MSDITITTTNGDTVVVTDLLPSNAAAVSAGIAITKAGEAAASAAAALTSENNAETAETNAATSASSASTSAGTATTQAGIAATQATAALASATAADVSADAALVSETNAASSATTATTQAGIATTQATAASASATTATAQAGIATTKAGEAASSAASLAAALESFRTQSLGSFASDPTLDGNGDPLQEGAEYFNTVSDTIRIYVNGAWEDYDYSAQQSTAAAALSASNAASSAGTAAAQANIATTKAGEASDSAAAASNSAGTASAQASTATTQAGIATAQATAAAASAVAADVSADAALVSETNADASEAAAAVSASAAATSATSASTSATTATTQAGTATAQASSAAGSASAASGSATTATNQAAAAAASALSAASVVAQDLSAIDRTVFAATVLDVVRYDTSKDSDGGAWRHRCSHTSWENETLSGNWLGSAANEAAARAISGATTGSYYYDTTAAGFYTLNAGSGKTATYRGNVRKFPAQVLITRETARMVVWDLTQAGVPMWMVFTVAGNNALTVNAVAASSAVGGQSQIVVPQAGGGGLVKICFLRDVVLVPSIYGTYRNKLAISGRNSVGGWISPQFTTDAIISSTIADVDMVVLPGAPLDATGLAVPTIALATDGNGTYSVSVMKDDGTVVNIASDTTGTAVAIEFDGLALKVVRSDGTVYVWNDVRALTTGASPQSTFTTASVPALLGVSSKQAKRAFGSSTGMTLVRRNQGAPAAGLVAYVTKDTNSGWLPGNVLGAWLADFVSGAVADTNLFTNGTFDSNTTGWASASGFPSTAAAVAGEMQVTATGAFGRQITSFATVVGVEYQVMGTARIVSGSGNAYVAQTSSTGGDVTTSGNITSGTASVILITFVAQETTSYISAAASVAGAVAGFDNLVCKVTSKDRSVRNTPIGVVGSLTKAAVATSAALMGYSGFSAANYFEQIYSPLLDLGTADFCVMGWIKEAPNSAVETLFSRGSYSGAWAGSAVEIVINAAGNVVCYITDDAYVSSDSITSSAAIDESAWRLVSLVRRSGYLELWIGQDKAATDVAVTNAAASLSNASAKLNLGRSVAGTMPLSNGTIALWRVSATAPTAQQIKHIYETELALFQTNAECRVAGTSTAVTALAYDEETDLLHVGTSSGRSAFKGLVRVASEATPVGAIVALAAGAGVIAQAGATAVDVYVPAYSLREELVRRAEQAAKLGAALEPLWYTATASQTAFPLPVGWKPKAVYRNGLLIRPDANDYSDTFDGFIWTTTLLDASTVGDFICIMGVRTNG